MPLLDAILSVVAPHSCLSCGNEGSLLCAWCKYDVFTPLPSRCYKCKAQKTDSAVCVSCRKSSRISHAWVATEYELVAKKLLHVYKFERARAAVNVIADAMEAALPFMPPETLVVPVPTSTGHIRQRGYDHAALIAREIAKTRKLMYLRPVVRITQSQQVGSNRKQRLTQLDGAFMVPKPSLVKGCNILLVDDVITTGATIEAVAKVLRSAGAKRVDVLAFASQSLG